MEVCSTAGGVIAALAAVYFCEYLVYPGFVDRDTLCLEGWTFTLCWVSYNLGVLISRASVAAFRIERLEVLAALQIVNLCFWAVEAVTHVLRDALGRSAVVGG